MMRRLLGITILLMATTTLTSQSRDPWMGTWKLNVPKSKLSYDAPQSHIETITTVPEGTKFTRDIVNAQGAKQHDEVVTKLDGKDLAVQGGANPNNTRAYKRIDARRYQVITKTNGKPSLINEVAVSPDGKTRTQTQKPADAKPGDAPTNTLVFERQ